MNKTNKKTNPKEQGALNVITIIITVAILVLLSGITIAALVGNGENGILARAQQSRLMNEIAIEKEKIETAVQSTIGTKYAGKIDGQALYNELKNN